MLEEDVLRTIQEYHMIGTGERVLVGVSGGADSLCLLFLLADLAERLGCSLAVGHVDHGMRETAGRDLDHVREAAERLGLPFYLEVMDVPALQRRWRCSPEEAARRARFAAFSGMLDESGAGVLALAHNRDDQAETLLLKLFRGAGLRGLAGIRPVHRMELGETGEVRVIRPLLFVPREEIEGWLRARGASWCTDETNEEDGYARNRMRHHLLPWAAAQINRQASRHVAEAAQRVREALEHVEAEAEKRYREICLAPGARGKDAPVALRLDVLRGETAFLRKEILRLACQDAGLGSDLEEVHFRSLEALAAGREGSRQVFLPDGFVAARTYDVLTIGPAGPSGRGRWDIPLRPGDGEAFSQDISGYGTVWSRIFVPDPALCLKIPTDPFTKWFDLDTIEGILCIRARQPGDWIHVGCGRRSVKKVLIDCKVPAGDRDGMPLLAAGDEILWIAGVRRCESHRVGAGTARILEVRFSPGYRFH